MGHAPDPMFGPFDGRMLEISPELISLLKGNNPISSTRKDSVSIEIAELQKRVKHLHAVSQSLAKETRLAEAALTYRSHALAHVRALPFEVLSQIFVAASTGKAIHLGYMLGVFIVSHVCSRWREVALSTPALWAAPKILIDNEYLENRNNTTLSILTEWNSRAGAQGLRLSFSFDTRSHQAIDTFNAIMHVLSSTVRALHFETYIGKLENKMFIPSLPNLRAVEFSGQYINHQFALNAPNLQCLDIRCEAFVGKFRTISAAAIPTWNQLSSLYLSLDFRCYAEQLSFLRLVSRTLRKLMLYRDDLMPRKRKQRDIAQIHLGDLQELILRDDSAEILNVISAPFLASFDVVVQNSTDWTTVFDFCGQASFKAECLSLTVNEPGLVTTDMLHAFLQRIPCTTVFTIQCFDQDGGWVDDLLTLLTFNETGHLLLQSLLELNIGNGYRGGSTVHLPDMVNSRIGFHARSNCARLRKIRFDVLPEAEQMQHEIDSWQKADLDIKVLGKNSPEL